MEETPATCALHRKVLEHVETLGDDDSYGKKLKAWLKDLVAGDKPHPVPRCDTREVKDHNKKARREATNEDAKHLHNEYHVQWEVCIAPPGASGPRLA